MRIGEFSKVNDLSIDTVRYYLSLNLINPRKKGKYFYFDESNQEELDFLLRMKNLRFTLTEIKEIIYLKNIENIHLEKRNERLKTLFSKQISKLEQEIEEMLGIKSMLKDELENILEESQEEEVHSGFPLTFIQYLACPLCGCALSFEDAMIRNNVLIEGNAICQCGFKLELEEGILYPDTPKSSILNPIEVGDHVDAFIEESPSSFLDFMFGSMNDLIKQCKLIENNDKIILDMKAGVGVMASQLIAQACTFKYLILVDEDPEKLKIAKMSLSKSFKNMDIVYICSDIKYLPIRKGAIDVAIDFTASLIDGFRHTDNIYNEFMKYLNESSWILGLYFYFKKFNVINRLPKENRKNFDGKSVFDIIENSGFEDLKNEKAVTLNEGHNINDFFKDGDEVITRLRYFTR